MGRRLSSSDFHDLAAKANIEWLEETPVPKALDRTTWRCALGHEWQAKYATIYSGHRCPVCGGSSPKTDNDFRALASERGLEWLGVTAVSTKTLTEWRCSSGHTWHAKYNTIQQGHGCPRCSASERVKSRRKSTEDYHVLAASRGLTWLGTEVKSVTTKTQWQCPNGHKWTTTFNVIANGSGCPHCSRANAAEKLRLTASDFHDLASANNLVWLGTTIPYSHEKTDWRCMKGHVWRTGYNVILQGSGCPICGRKRVSEALRLPPSTYFALAKERGFTWLGPEVPNGNTHTQWQCSSGHTWLAGYDKIQSGRGCPICKGQRNAERRRHDTEKYKQLAQTLGIQWLGPEVKRVTQKSAWRCAQGHEWQSSFANLRQGRGCPICQSYVNGAPTSKPQRKLAEMVGGDLNVPCGKYRIDIGLRIDGISIGIEYDCWYWHKDQVDADSARVRFLVSKGWRVLTIKANRRLPSLATVLRGLEKLSPDHPSHEIVMSDWGK